MTHWGWYWKVKQQHTPKTLCSDVPCLDSFALAKVVKIGDHDRHNCAVTIDDVQHTIRLQRDSCHLGGYRYYFITPCCDKRMRKLYYVEQRFGCRACLKLAYRTQRLAPSRRNAAMSKKVEGYIKQRGGTVYDKPKSMHHTTWQALKSRLYQYNDVYEHALREELSKYYPSMRKILQQW